MAMRIREGHSVLERWESQMPLQQLSESAVRIARTVAGAVVAVVVVSVAGLHRGIRVPFHHRAASRTARRRVVIAVVFVFHISVGGFASDSRALRIAEQIAVRVVVIGLALRAAIARAAAFRIVVTVGTLDTVDPVEVRV